MEVGAFGDEDISVHHLLPMKRADIARPSRPPQMPVNIVDFFDLQFYREVLACSSDLVGDGAPRDKHVKG